MAEIKKTQKKISKDYKKDKKGQKKTQENDGDSSDSSFLFDSEGFIDEKDKEELMQKTQKEREAILLERYNSREERIKQKQLEKEQKKLQQQAESKKLNENKNTKLQALDELTLKRKLEKEKTKNTNERKSSDDIRLSDEDDDDSSLDSEFPESHNRKKEEEDEEISKFMKKNDGSKKKTINTIGKIEEKSFEMKDIESIRLTRHMIEKIISQPNFEKTVKGCFVRVSVSSDKNRSNYAIAEIIDVLEGSKSYKIDIKETKKVLLLKHADKEKKFEISFVSNGRLESREFANWQEKINQKKLAFPTPTHIKEKIQEINQALNYKYNDEELTEIIKKKIEQKISVDSPSSKDLTAEINYFTQRLGTLEFEYFQEKTVEKGQQIKEIKEKLAILKEKNKKFHEAYKKRDVMQEVMMKKMFGNYNNKNVKSKTKDKSETTKKIIKKSISPKKSFCSFEEKLHHCSTAKELESLKEEFLSVFKAKFSFEDEIESWGLEENTIL